MQFSPAMPYPGSLDVNPERTTTLHMIWVLPPIGMQAFEAPGVWNSSLAVSETSSDMMRLKGEVDLRC